MYVAAFKIKRKTFTNIS